MKYKETQVYAFTRSKIREVIDNQIHINTYKSKNKNLDNHLNTENLIKKYKKLINENINKIDFTLDKNKESIDLLKQELADIFILGLEFSIHMKQQNYIYDLMCKDWIRVIESENIIGAFEGDETNYSIMKMRLNVIKTRFSELFKEKFGLFLIRGIIDIIVMYGYRDFIGIVIDKQVLMKLK